MKQMSLYFSKGINEKIALDKTFSIFILKSLKRYFSFDWGDCCDEDKEMNNLALKDEGRLFSVYLNNVEKIWIITEQEPYRFITTVLFPDEY